MVLVSEGGCRAFSGSGRTLFVLGVLPFLVSCGWSFPNGHYEGILSRSINSKFVTDPVGIDVVTDKASGTIEIKYINDKSITTLNVSNFKNTGFNLVIPLLRKEPFALKKEGSCFFNTPEALPGFSLDMCFDEKAFLLKVVDANRDPVLTLSGNSFSVEKRIQYEPARKMTVSEMVQRALGRNFETRLEYEKVIQAKKASQSAYLNLLPRLNLGTIVNVATADLIALPVVLLDSIGDLAPFLLPNRWSQALGSSELGHAEATTKLLMNANLATQVEGFAYVYERDKDIHEFYKDLVKRLIVLNEETVKLDASGGTFPVGSGKYLNMLIDSYQLELTKAETIRKLDRYTLSQILGFNNPESIDEVELDVETTLIENAAPLDSQELADTALRRSFELKQVDYLIRASRFEKSELYFSWLDPQTDPTKNFGFALIPQFQIAKSKIRELEINREQLQQLVVEKAYETVADYNEALKTYPLAQKIYNQTGEYLNEYIVGILSHGEFEGEELQIKVDSAISNYVQAKTILSSFRIARSKVDRMMLQGYFFYLLPNVDSPLDNTDPKKRS